MQERSCTAALFILVLFAQQDAVVIQSLPGIFPELFQQVIHRHPTALLPLHINTMRPPSIIRVRLPSSSA